MFVVYNLCVRLRKSCIHWLDDDRLGTYHFWEPDLDRVFDLMRLACRCQNGVLHDLVHMFYTGSIVKCQIDPSLLCISMFVAAYMLQIVREYLFAW